MIVAECHLKAHEEQIIELSGDDEYDVYLQRLPEVLAETFELTRNSLNKEENKSKKRRYTQTHGNYPF